MVHGGGDKYVPSTDIRREEYERAVEIVCRAIQKTYRADQVILLKHYYADSYMDDKGMHRYIRDRVDENDKTLELVKYIESLVERHLEGCHRIEFPDGVLGASRHRFGICSLHYHPLYYVYAREALEVIFQGLPGETMLLEQLRRNYSMEFRMLRLEMMNDYRSKVFEREIDNIASLGRWKKVPSEGELAEILLRQNSIEEYLDVLYMLREEIILLAAVKDTAGFYRESLVLRKWKRLGFTNYPSKLWWMYAGVVFRGTALVNLSAEGVHEPVEAEQWIGNKKMRLRSESFKGGNQAIIEIDGKDHSLNRRGINIVVCSASDGNVLDSVSYDSHIMESFSRK